MRITSKKGTLVLLVGDLVLFYVALWLSFLIRNASYPDSSVFLPLLQPFAIIFIFWIIVFYIADLYGKHTSIFRRKLPRVILNAQIANSVLAIIFFYYFPYFGVAPKTLLFVDLFVSFFLIFAWRNWLAPNIHLNLPEKIYFACAGQEAEEIIDEIKSNSSYNITLASEREIKNIKGAGITAIVVNLYDKDIDLALKNFYGMIFSGIRFISIHSLYEEFFDREPVQSLKEQWFLENISNRPKPVYDGLKRVMDVAVAGVLGLISLIFYPFVYLAIKTEDNGVIFSEQERVGKDNQPIKLLKFRTMTVANDGGEWGKTENNVTKVGAWLRKTRIDELPQLWNVLRSDISLIGPRPEFADPVSIYSADIPYYNIRHIIKPGLSGWAQIYGEHPHHGIDIESTRNKFSYDLYYIKNRSFWLDLSVALKTIKILILQKGK